MAGVAVSDSPFGPFRFLRRQRLSLCPPGQIDCFPASKGEARDMNLFRDSDGTAYIVYTSANNKTLYISRLDESYVTRSSPRKTQCMEKTISGSSQVPCGRLRCCSEGTTADIICCRPAQQGGCQTRLASGHLIRFSENGGMREILSGDPGLIFPLTPSAPVCSKEKTGSGFITETAGSRPISQIPVISGCLCNLRKTAFGLNGCRNGNRFFQFIE